MKHYLFIYGELNGGGAERVLLDVLGNFDYTKNKVDLLQINVGGVLSEEIPKEVNLLSAWCGYEMSYRVALRMSLWFNCQKLLRKRLKDVIGEKHYDVAISFLEGMPTKCHALITEIADRNYSWVHCDLHKFHYTSNLFRKDEELGAYNRMKAVVAVSNDTAQAFRQRFPACRTEVKVIYNPIDCKKIVNLANAEEVCHEKFTIIVCGRLTPQKRIDRVLRLANRIKKENLNIAIQIIGDGELKNELVELAEALQVNDIVQFGGYKKNPYPYIKSADMLLSTSIAEGFSLVICEAMALRVSIVATRTSGPSEILKNNKFGMLCEHDDESIYEAVLRMYRDNDLRLHYAKIGKERVKKFSVENTMKSIYKL